MQLQSISDKTAIGISALCAIHCLFVPLAVLALPSLSGSFFVDEHFHQFLIYLVLPVSIIAMTLGCRKHSQYRVWALGGAGLVLLVAAAFVMHDLVGELGEQLMTVAGTFLIAGAHWQNYRLCREKSCGCKGQSA